MLNAILFAGPTAPNPTTVFVYAAAVPGCPPQGHNAAQGIWRDMVGRLHKLHRRGELHHHITPPFPFLWAVTPVRRLTLDGGSRRRSPFTLFYGFKFHLLTRF